MAARLTLKCPVRWTSMTACQSSGNMLWNILSRRMPAALNTMCNPPNVSRACCTIFRQSSKAVTEPKLAPASPPAALISSAVACAGRVSPPSPAPPTPGSTTTILAPCRAISLATSAPTPRAAPVQIATRPSNIPIAAIPSSYRSGKLSRRRPALSIRPGARGGAQVEVGVGGLFRGDLPADRQQAARMGVIGRAVDRLDAEQCAGAVAENRKLAALDRAAQDGVVVTGGQPGDLQP